MSQIVQNQNIDNKEANSVDSTFIEYVQYIEEPFVKGLIRIIVLSALRDGEKRGYQIYQYVRAIVKARVSLSTLYTVLRELTIKGFVTKIKNVYRLTEKGLKALHMFVKRYSGIESLFNTGSQKP